MSVINHEKCVFHFMPKCSEFVATISHICVLFPVTLGSNMHKPDARVMAHTTHILAYMWTASPLLLVSWVECAEAHGKPPCEGRARSNYNIHNMLCIYVGITNNKGTQPQPVMPIDRESEREKNRWWREAAKEMKSKKENKLKDLRIRLARLTCFCVCVGVFVCV